MTVKSSTPILQAISVREPVRASVGPASGDLVRELSGIGTQSAAVRLLRDMTLCAGGTILGARIDGPLAYFIMQAICGKAGFAPLRSLSVHLDLLPATSAIMIVIAMICQWPGNGAARQGAGLTGRERVVRWSSYAVRVVLLFGAMMLAMSLMQAPFRLILPASPSSAILASVTGMLALAVLGAALRPLALRVPFLVPLCCR